MTNHSVPSFTINGPKKILSIFDVFDFKTVVNGRYASDYKSFDIAFPSLDHGWFPIKWSFYNQEVMLLESLYEGGTGDLKLWLETVIDLFYAFGDSRQYNRVAKNHYRILVDEESTLKMVDMKIIGSQTVKVLIRDSANLEYEDDWFYGDLDFDEFTLEHKIKTQEELESRVLLAIEIDIDVFLARFYIACLKFLHQVGITKYEQAIKEPFPFDLLKKLELIILSKTSSRIGLWSATEEEVPYLYHYPIDEKQMRVAGRRMCTEEELMLNRLLEPWQ